ncbi:protein PHLOEM PROTEIN 2-LIKE A9-like [Aristolochia californica]|uniref:protein PHLOEM PROTEIN 2-LIKE A9-like n=1 Tax=Aristolochia californica TaxID=171875 RepID=UPI0035E1C5EF
MGSHWTGSLDSLKWSDEKKEFTISPHDLDIIWGRDPRYWKISKNKDVVELLQVCWLQVSGKIPFDKFKNKAGTYKVQFEVKLKPDAFGWSASPVYFLTKVGDKPYRWFKCSIPNKEKDGNQFPIPEKCEFTIGESETYGKGEVIFGMYEIWRGKWKGGLDICEVHIKKI